MRPWEDGTWTAECLVPTQRLVAQGETETEAISRVQGLLIDYVAASKHSEQEERIGEFLRIK